MFLLEKKTYNGFNIDLETNTMRSCLKTMFHYPKNRTPIYVRVCVCFINFFFLKNSASNSLEGGIAPFRIGKAYAVILFFAVVHTRFSQKKKNKTRTI